MRAWWVRVEAKMKAQYWMRRQSTWVYYKYQRHVAQRHSPLHEASSAVPCRVPYVEPVCLADAKKQRGRGMR
jgi:hypothetical protein